MRRFGRLILILLAGSGCLAQPLPRDILAGSVQDPSGAGIQGAKLTLKRADGMGERTTSSDGTGAFRFDAVPTGSYELSVEKQPFRPVTAQVRIGSRPLGSMRIVMRLADVRQEITVSTPTAQVSTDTSENLDVVALDRQALDNLPAFDQDYIGTMSRFLDSGAVGTGGVTLIVDGLETTRAGVSASAISAQPPRRLQLGLRFRF